MTPAPLEATGLSYHNQAHARKKALECALARLRQIVSTDDPATCKATAARALAEVAGIMTEA